jgi:hypothetical protein
MRSDHEPNTSRARFSSAVSGRPDATLDKKLIMSKNNDDLRADQLNPNKDDYWESSGWDERPDDWEERVNNDDLNGLFPPVNR